MKNNHVVKNFRTFGLLAAGSLLLIMMQAGCRKKSSGNQKTTFTKTFSSEVDLCANGSAMLDDGHFVLVSADYVNSSDLRHPGQMVKINANGEVIWTKPISEKVRTVYRVIPLRGVGYAILGIFSSYEFHRNLCIYDLNGNLLSEHKVITNSWNGYTPHSDIIQLRNGNLAVAGGDEMDQGFGTLKVLDSSFQLLHSKAFFGTSGSKGASLWGMCEQVDGNLALMARGFNNKGNTSVMLIRTRPDGREISRTPVSNPYLNETANALLPHGEGLVAVTCTSNPATKEGVLVNYTNNFNRVGQLVSGRINLLEFDNDGKLLRRLLIDGYNGNGMIRSMKSTADRGFILCGTVGQSSFTNRVSFTSIFLLKLNSKLEVEWQKTIKSSYPAFGVDVQQVKEGGYLITGYIRSFNTRLEMIAIKTNAHGDL